jgi:hypothetical protein
MPGAITQPQASPGAPAFDPRPVAFGVAALLFLTYAYFVAAPSWNENSRFALVRALVDGHVNIDPYQQDTGDKAVFAGHTYSDKAPGSSLLAVPAYASYLAFLRLTGGQRPTSLPAAAMLDPDAGVLVNASFRRALYLCNLFTNALAGALLGGLFFLTLSGRFGVAPRPALVATLALTVGSLVFPYATMFYGHVLAAAFLFGAFALLAPAPSVRRLAGAGLLCGLAVLTELPTLPAAAGLAAYALWLARPRRAALWLAAGALGPAIALGAYQTAAFGVPWATGYAHVSRPDFAAGMSHGIFGIGWPRPAALAALLAGRARGLLYTSPVLLLAFIGLGRRLVATWRSGRAEAVVMAGLVVYFLLLTAGYYMWWGGSAFGPRQAIPALPFLCLGLPFAFARRRSIVAGLLLAVSIANQLAATAVEPSAPLVPDVLRDFLYPHLWRGDVPLVPGAGNMGAVFRLHGVASLLPLLVLWGLALHLLIPLLPPSAPRPMIPNPERGARPSEAGPA